MIPRDYLRIVVARWRVFLACILLGLLAAVLASTLPARVYQASVQIFVSTDPTQDQTQLNQGNTFAQSRVQSYVAIVTAPQILAGIENDLHLGLTNAQLRAKLSADAPTTQTIIDIHATDTSPARAAAIANSASRAFISTVEKFDTPAGKSVPVIKLIVTQPATAPRAPISPQPVLDIALGLTVGLLVGIAAAVLRETLDNTIKNAEDMAKAAGTAVLTSIVVDPDTKRRVIASRAHTHGPRAEGFRQLRTNLQFTSLDDRPRIIAVTSSVPGEGKTSTAINLAAALSEAESTVCLVDADLRRPGVADALGLVSSVGLTNVLTDKLSLDRALQKCGDDLFVLTSGPIPPNPSEVLASTRMRELITTLAGRFDFVVIDTAPLLPVADGAEVAAIADGCLVIARFGSTTQTQVQRGRKALDQVNARVLGAVLNQVSAPRGNGYEYQSYGPTESGDGEPSGSAGPAASASGSAKTSQARRGLPADRAAAPVAATRTKRPPAGVR